MASTHLLFMSSSDQPPRTQPNQRPEPTPNPKPQGRKGGKAQKGPNKAPQRGMGVEKLELERLKQGGFSPTTKIIPHYPTNYSNTHFSNYSHYQYPMSPLAGVSVYPYPSAIRILPMGSEAVELPSMPNQLPNNKASDVFTFKKKKVVGEEGEISVGFGKGKEIKCAQDYQQIVPAAYNYGVINNYIGFNLHSNINSSNEDHSDQYFGANDGGYHPTCDSTGSEVLAIHKKTSGSNWMMEYGFFPDKSVQSNGEDQFKDYHTNQNNMINNASNNNANSYYKSMEKLDLKMGCSDTSSPSSSTSLSSLTTASTTTNTAVGDLNSSSPDLSLKLSYY